MGDLLSGYGKKTLQVFVVCEDFHADLGRLQLRVKVRFSQAETRISSWYVQSATSHWRETAYPSLWSVPRTKSQWVLVRRLSGVQSAAY
jgi:hypothetical protein